MGEFKNEMTAQLTLGGLITRIVINFRKLGQEKHTASAIKNRQTLLQTYWDEFRCRHAKLLALAGDEHASDKYFTSEHFDEIESEYLSAIDYFAELLELKQPASASATMSQQSHCSRQDSGDFRYPKITLPKFSGDVREWDEYKNMFITLVDSNTSLTDVQKLHYLKTNVTGEALNMLRNITLSVSNYAAAWAAMQRRYDNKRLIVMSYIRALIKVPNVPDNAALAGLKTLRDHMLYTVTAFENMGRSIKTNDIFIFVIVDKFDKATTEEWELKMGSSEEIPDFDVLSDFIDLRIRVLGSIASKTIENVKFKAKEAKVHQTSCNQKQCPRCHEKHPLYMCKTFKQDTPCARRKFAADKRLCFNCMKSGHNVANCPSKYVCSRCKQRHHSMLHPEPEVNKNVDVKMEGEKEKPSTSSAAIHTCTGPQLISNLLPTAIIKLSAPNGRSVVVRALLDQGSQVTCVSTKVVRLLRVKTKPTLVSLHGVGDTSLETIDKSVILQLSARDAVEHHHSVHALVLSKLSTYVPAADVQDLKWPELDSLPLADPTPCDGTQIDCVLGTGDVSLVMKEGVKREPSAGLLAQETIFGWVVSGNTQGKRNLAPYARVLHMSTSVDLDDNLRRFWELEEVPEASPLSSEDIICEEYFQRTHTRTNTGRYVVALPFKDGVAPNLGDTYSRAKAQFLRTESRLLKQPELYDQYQSFLREYESAGHMRVNAVTTPREDDVFIPHLPVMRPDSQTTKLRVVFNASSVSTQGKSLNDYLYPGPNLQGDLRALLLKWRTYRYVYSADLAKMFRQILVRDEDTRYQQILWRPSTSQDIESFRLLTVTYGTACAPYLANRVLKQLAQDEGKRFPLASNVLTSNFYVDDVLFGSDDRTTLRQLRDQLIQLLMAGGFFPRKWASNDRQLLTDLAEEDCGLAVDKSLSEQEQVKVLGITWNPAGDLFKYRCQTPVTKQFTKRTFLSLVAGIYDPLGWAAPFLIKGKALIQTMWLHKFGWDDLLPCDIQVQCSQFCEQIEQLSLLQIDRWLGVADDCQSIELHGFSDASKAAYAAVVYVRITSACQSTQVSLVCAKTKVAPLKVISIPRLELCGAMLLSKLMVYVLDCLQLGKLPMFSWVDSKTTLDWLRTPPNKIKRVFEANRVSYIQQKLPTAVWRYVPGNSNPADCASRGISVNELREHKLWWNGPPWLLASPEEWPQMCPTQATLAADAECLITRSVPSNADLIWDLPSRASSWNKLSRVVSYIYRFLDACRLKQRPHQDLTVTATELERAQVLLLRLEQQKAYALEIDLLRKSLSIGNKSQISSLNPLLDKDGLLRVGGRLKHSQLSETQKHPILVPKGRLAELLLSHFHLHTLHGGTQVTLRVLREHFWVVSARSIVRTVIGRCVPCARMRNQPQNQLMGDLPKVRITQTRPFQHIGLDYAGPLQVRLAGGRGHKSQKCYIAIFVCMTVKCIHLELVTDYTTATFIAAFDRFIARRGLPYKVYSDNGTNFKGAERELALNFARVMKDETLRSRLSSDLIQWHFIPPGAPHFGGLWEAGVKSTKHHLRRIMGQFTPTYEELQTLLCKVEAVLNSRPLTPMYDDPDSLEVITPGHFLTGTLMTARPTPSVLDLKTKQLSRWQTLQAMYERFWKLWSSDYLNSLQSRVKWRQVKPNLRIGDVVLLRDVNAPPAKWLLGRVIEVYPGPDGYVRRVLVKTATSRLERPITQLAKLPVESSQS